MNHKTVVERISELVEYTCKQPTNIYGYTMWTHHIITVKKFALMLADRFNANKDVVELSALLHDYAAVKNEKFVEQHHIIGASLAGEILSNLSYPEDKIKDIQLCIESHRASVPYEIKTPEALCVASADGMTHIDQLPSLFFAVYTKRNFDVDDGKVWIREKLKRTWGKMCKEAQDIMQKKYLCALKVLE
jgi:uncharacterized protein